MTKQDIANVISETYNIPKSTAKKYTDAFFKIMQAFLKNNEPVFISEFGTFKVKERKARKGRNPKTGEIIDIEERKAVAFKPSAMLKRQMNETGV